MITLVVDGLPEERAKFAAQLAKDYRMSGKVVVHFVKPMTADERAANRDARGTGAVDLLIFEEHPRG